MPSRRLDANFMKTGLICPEPLAHIEYTDENRTGLYIEVRSTSQGQGTFWHRFKDDSNRTARIKIGRTIDVTLQQAKEQVATLRAKKQLGQDIAGEERKRKKSITWNEFFEDWYLPHVKQHKRSWANDEEMHRLRIKDRFGDTKISNISRHAVQRFHGELKESGLSPATADHYAKLLRQAIGLAVSWDLLSSHSLTGLKLFNEDNREERLMSSGELQRLITVLENEENKTKVPSLVIRFLMMTGARVNEALHAMWKDIDRENRTWLIQATNSKSKRRRSVPLNDAALAVLDELKTDGKSDWLFTSSRGGGRMTTINKIWQRLRGQAGLPHLRLHDLRHQYASMLVNSGRTLYEVQQILGHSDPTVTQRYAHLSSASLQDAAKSASDTVNAALKSGS